MSPPTSPSPRGFPSALAVATSDAGTPDASRRHALRWLGGAGAGLLAAPRLRAAPPTAAPVPAPTPACPLVATETAGPFPADGSRPGFGPGPGTGPGPDGPPPPGFGPDGSHPPGPPPGGAGMDMDMGMGPGPRPGPGADASPPLDVLDVRLVRADIRADTDGRNLQPGVPLALELTVRDADGCAPLAGVFVYVWHCSRDGRYSGYGDAPGRDFLRGVQPTDAQGRVRFATVYPGRYEGRATHIHAAVFPAAAAPGFDPARRRATTQFALPDETSAAVYATAPGYAANQRRGTPANAADGLFADGVETELLAVSGHPESGYVARLAINV